MQKLPKAHTKQKTNIFLNMPIVMGNEIQDSLYSVFVLNEEVLYCSDCAFGGVCTSGVVMNIFIFASKVPLQFLGLEYCTENIEALHMQIKIYFQ